MVDSQSTLEKPRLLRRRLLEKGADLGNRGVGKFQSRDAGHHLVIGEFGDLIVFGTKGGNSQSFRADLLLDGRVNLIRCVAGVL